MHRLSIGSPRTWILAIPLLSLFACKTDDGDGDVAAAVLEAELPEAAAETTCELIYGCSCESPGEPDQPSCVEAERSELSEAQLTAQGVGLTYDGQCAGDLLAAAEAAGCAATLDLTCESFCAVYHGDLPVDSGCTVPVAAQPTWSDCAQGLWCVSGACQDPCGGASMFLGLGEACRDQSGSLGTCDPTAGLWCDFETEVCIALPDVGEPCYLSEICGLGAVCDYSTPGEPICAALPGVGEACTFACEAGSYCNGVDGAEGVCQPLPGEGEPCVGGNCGEGSYCNDDLICEALPAWVCQ